MENGHRGRRHGYAFLVDTKLLSQCRAPRTYALRSSRTKPLEARPPPRGEQAEAENQSKLLQKRISTGPPHYSPPPDMHNPAETSLEQQQIEATKKPLPVSYQTTERKGRAPQQTTKMWARLTDSSQRPRPEIKSKIDTNLPEGDEGQLLRAVARRGMQQSFQTGPRALIDSVLEESRRASYKGRPLILCTEPIPPDDLLASFEEAEAEAETQRGRGGVSSRDVDLTRTVSGGRKGKSPRGDISLPNQTENTSAANDRQNPTETPQNALARTLPPRTSLQLDPNVVAASNGRLRGSRRPSNFLLKGAVRRTTFGGCAPRPSQADSLAAGSSELASDPSKRQELSNFMRDGQSLRHSIDGVVESGSIRIIGEGGEGDEQSEGAKARGRSRKAKEKKKKRKKQPKEGEGEGEEGKSADESSSSSSSSSSSGSGSDSSSDSSSSSSSGSSSRSGSSDSSGDFSRDEEASLHGHGATSRSEKPFLATFKKDSKGEGGAKSPHTKDSTTGKRSSLKGGLLLPSPSGMTGVNMETSRARQLKDFIDEVHVCADLTAKEAGLPPPETESPRQKALVEALKKGKPLTDPDPDQIERQQRLRMVRSANLRRSPPRRRRRRPRVQRGFSFRSSASPSRSPSANSREDEKEKSFLGGLSGRGEGVLADGTVEWSPKSEFSSPGGVSPRGGASPGGAADGDGGEGTTQAAVMRGIREGAAQRLALEKQKERVKQRQILFEEIKLRVSKLTHMSRVSSLSSVVSSIPALKALLSGLVSIGISCGTPLSTVAERFPLCFGKASRDRDGFASGDALTGTGPGGLLRPPTPSESRDLKSSLEAEIPWLVESDPRTWIFFRALSVFPSAEDGSLGFLPQVVRAAFHLVTLYQNLVDLADRIERQRMRRLKLQDNKRRGSEASSDQQQQQMNGSASSQVHRGSGGSVDAARGGALAILASPQMAAERDHSSLPSAQQARGKARRAHRAVALCRHAQRLENQRKAHRELMERRHETARVTEFLQQSMFRGAVGVREGGLFSLNEENDQMLVPPDRPFGLSVPFAAGPFTSLANPLSVHGAIPGIGVSRAAISMSTSPRGVRQPGGERSSLSPRGGAQGNTNNLNRQGSVQTGTHEGAEGRRGDTREMMKQQSGGYTAEDMKRWEQAERDGSTQFGILCEAKLLQALGQEALQMRDPPPEVLFRLVPVLLLVEALHSKAPEEEEGDAADSQTHGDASTKSAITNGERGSPKGPLALEQEQGGGSVQGQAEREGTGQVDFSPADSGEKGAAEKTEGQARQERVEGTLGRDPAAGDSDANSESQPGKLFLELFFPKTEAHEALFEKIRADTKTFLPERWERLKNYLVSQCLTKIELEAAERFALRQATQGRSGVADSSSSRVKIEAGYRRAGHRRSFFERTRQGRSRGFVSDKEWRRGNTARGGGGDAVLLSTEKQRFEVLAKDLMTATAAVGDGVSMSLSLKEKKALLRRTQQAQTGYVPPSVVAEREREDEAGRASIWEKERKGGGGLAVFRGKWRDVFDLAREERKNRETGLSGMAVGRVWGEPVQDLQTRETLLTKYTASRGGVVGVGNESSDVDARGSTIGDGSVLMHTPSVAGGGTRRANGGPLGAMGPGSTVSDVKRHAQIAQMISEALACAFKGRDFLAAALPQSEHRQGSRLAAVLRDSLLHTERQWRPSFNSSNPASPSGGPTDVSPRAAASGTSPRAGGGGEAKEEGGIADEEGEGRDRGQLDASGKYGETWKKAEKDINHANTFKLASKRKTYHYDDLNVKPQRTRTGTPDTQAASTEQGHALGSESSDRCGSAESDDQFPEEEPFHIPVMTADGLDRAEGSRATPLEDRLRRAERRAQTLCRQTFGVVGPPRQGGMESLELSRRVASIISQDEARRKREAKNQKDRSRNARLKASESNEVEGPPIFLLTGTEQ
uniref:Uncharacterized protein n=1 Tax=Chromera velia CCMP2878 TaxID=1169474 RepID=A0A0G4GSC8_9ALVE|eukprot:Cvel_5134.t1-p1 / transcript=Cvel_5134.t1 / gene=Cvel_5134 / organism=Chromera_velia_CCMP2878 / gene_product=hypothetical protein / transcript_product=hypothetical protein / location=Cvel_scaffold235:27189-39848(-) / protein_length=1923 / sequence_SO=supercontig / SO=protein_coding / is_pseudo=false